MQLNCSIFDNKDTFRYDFLLGIFWVSIETLLLNVVAKDVTIQLSLDTLFNMCLFPHIGITIQSSTHDSTEDACTALRLYQRYKELMQKGEQEFHGTLNRLYETGRSLAWQVED